jgi:hypothetical protein
MVLSESMNTAGPIAQIGKVTTAAVTPIAAADQITDFERATFLSIGLCSMTAMGRKWTPRSRQEWVESCLFIQVVFEPQGF